MSAWWLNQLGAQQCRLDKPHKYSLIRKNPLQAQVVKGLPTNEPNQ